MTPAPIPTDSGAPVKLLDRKHSVWKLYKDEWDALDILFEGGVRLKNYGSTLLMKRPKELYDVYTERYRRLTYEDLLANCIRWYGAKLFSSEAKIDGKTKDQRWEDFLQDCDRGGTTFASFTTSLFETMMKFQTAFVLIDKPSPGAPVETRADEQAQGLDRPYLVTYTPTQTINWEVDAYGSLNWVIFKALTQSQDDPLGDIKQSVSWYVFDRTTYRHYRYDIKKEMADSGPIFNTEASSWAEANAVAELVDGPSPHALSAKNRVPVRICALPGSLWFANAAYLQLCEHLDFLNSYAWKLFVACHPQLVIYTDSEVKGQTSSEVAYLKFEKGDRVEWLEPDGKSFAECRMYLGLMRQEIYRSFHLQAQGKDSSASADGASGYSKELEMMPATDMLNAFGDAIRAHQELILTDYKEAAGMPVDGDNHPDVNGYKFENKPALQEISKAQAVIDLGLADKSKTLEQVLDENVAVPLLDGQNEETKNKVLAELKAAPTRKEAKDAEEAAQQQAFEQRFQRQTATNVLSDEKDSVAA